MERFRIISTVIIVLITINLFSQNTYDMPLNDDDEIEYQKVIDEKGSSDVLYKRAEEWITENFRTLSSKITLMDSENEKITGIRKANIEYEEKKEPKKLSINKEVEIINHKQMIRFDFTLEFKNDRYRLTLNNFRVASNSALQLERYFADEDPKQQEVYKALFAEVDKAAKEFMEIIEEALKAEEEEVDEW